MQHSHPHRVHSLGLPFNEIQGYAPGNVPAYSNGDDEFFSMERHVFHGIFMGYKWQCVEFARRWMLLRKGMLFGDIPTAAQMWEELKTAKRVLDGKTFAIKTCPNGSPAPPQADTLLIYIRSDDNPFGHVAVITEVLPNSVRVAEQNRDFFKWPGTYAREIPLQVIDGKFYILDEDEIFGWLEVEEDDQQLAGIDLLENLHLLDSHRFNQPKGWMRRIKMLVGEDVLDPPWLSHEDPIEDIFINTWGADLLRKGDRTLTYYGFGRELVIEMGTAANDLHRMFLQATEKVLSDDTILAQFGIPEVFWNPIKRSWKLHRNITLTGRFDFAYDGKSLKMFEYNADSASTLFECAVIQAKWANAVGLGDRGWSSGGQLHSRLVKTWKQFGFEKLVHLLIDTQEVEEHYTALYVGRTATEAGLRTKLCRGLDGLYWQSGKLVDSDGERVTVVWKTWSWETVFTDYLNAQDERKGMEQDEWKKDGAQPRLSDILLDPEMTVLEPLWKTITSNKALLPLLWSMFPKHPNLLRTEWEVSDALRHTGFVGKPMVGRCGRNVTVVGADGAKIEESSGEFGARATIYQQLFELPCYDGYFPVIGAWIIGGAMCGFGVREDLSRITSVDSPVAACRVLWREQDG